MGVIDIFHFDAGVRARIVLDSDPVSPAEWDNLGEITYTSDKYRLGTKHVSRDEAVEIRVGLENGNLIGLPVYAYVHGGCTISTEPFGDPWDSGQSGIVYTTKEKVLAEYGGKRITPEVCTGALNRLRAEVETYNQYLTSDVYGVIVELIDDKGGVVELETCWGFYGLDYTREEAKRMANACSLEIQRAAAKAQLKAQLEASEAQFWAERDIVTA